MTQILMKTPRVAQPADLMQAQISPDAISAALEGLFPADQLQAFLAPEDEIATFAYGLWSTAEGRKLIEWLLDMTIRAPYRVMGKSVEETALWAAKREGINLPAEMLLAAISKGEKIVAARNGAKT